MKIQRLNHFSRIAAARLARLAALLLLVLLLSGLTVSMGLGKAEVATAFSLDWSVISGGGQMGSAGGSYTLSGSIGQPAPGGSLVGTTYTLNSGFWHGITFPSLVFLPVVVK